MGALLVSSGTPPGGKMPLGLSMRAFPPPPRGMMLSRLVCLLPFQVFSRQLPIGRSDLSGEGEFGHRGSSPATSTPTVALTAVWAGHPPGCYGWTLGAWTMDGSEGACCCGFGFLPPPWSASCLAPALSFRSSGAESCTIPFSCIFFSLWLGTPNTMWRRSGFAASGFSRS